MLARHAPSAILVARSPAEIDERGRARTGTRARAPVISTVAGRRGGGSHSLPERALRSGRVNRTVPAAVETNVPGAVLAKVALFVLVAETAAEGALGRPCPSVLVDVP